MTRTAAWVLLYAPDAGPLLAPRPPFTHLARLLISSSRVALPASSSGFALITSPWAPKRLRLSMDAIANPAIPCPDSNPLMCALRACGVFLEIRGAVKTPPVSALPPPRGICLFGAPFFFSVSTTWMCFSAARVPMIRHPQTPRGPMA